MRFAKALAASVLFVAACANGHLSQGFTSDTDGGADDGGAPLIVGAPRVADGGSGDPLGDGCAQTATLVYLTGEGDNLYSFYPPTRAFTLIGHLACLAGATHLTVDRSGTAWVVAAGQLYTASTTDASCAPVATWKPDLPYSDFSLAFTGTTAAADGLLYLLNPSVTLYTFDVGTGVRALVDPVLNVASTEGDMTSDANGGLFFLRDASVHTLYQLDPKTAAIVKEDTVGATAYGSQALAFWGGSFYAFENDSIYQFDPKKGTTVVVGPAPMKVTGAGQSTCVPKVPVIK